jgi:ABC-type nitrate/sulfonate/bicarbonate transport system substrate-binding protein
MDKVAFPYRASSHLALLHVIAESGAWAKYGLDVDYDRQISKSDAHALVPTGEVEFVGGNHVSTYGHRARGDSWVYLGQTVNRYTTKLAVHPESGINGLSDLRGKVVATRGNHPGLNDWLYLKQHGLDVDRDEVEFVKSVDGELSAEAASQEDAKLGHNRPKRQPLWHWVRDRKVDAALLTAPSSLFAEDAGLKLIDIESMPMVWFTTISSSLGFVQKHPDIVERFLKGMIEGIHFYKTQPERAIRVLQERYTREGQMNLAQATYTYQTVVDMLEPKLYPSMKAIANVYEEAKRQDKDAEKINPLELWDLHAIRRIDDSGFISRLYGGDVRGQNPAPVDPEERREKEKKQAEVIAAVKACGHLVGVDCGCAS